MGRLHLIEQVRVLDAHGAARVMDVLIDGDRFAGLAPRIDLSTVRLDARTDGRGKLMIPGLVNAHHHSHDRFDKGRFSGLPLEIWMGRYQPPTHCRGWTPREVHLRTLLNGIEMLRNGITTVVDDIHFGTRLDPEVVQAAFDAYALLGMRADVGVAWCDRPYQDGIPYLAERLPDALKGAVPPGAAEAVLECWQELARRWNGRVRFVFSPSGPQRCSAAFLQKTWELAERHARPVLIHLLETRIQKLTAAKCHGISMTEYLDRLGLLTARSVLAHGVWLGAAELDLIAARGASVIHNPACNMKLGSGLAPVAEMLRRGIAVGLGTDNNNGNDLNSMFDAMRLAAFSGALLDTSPASPVDARQAFAMATAGGARVLGLDDRIGAIAIGKQADFCLVDLGTSAFMPLNDLPTQLVFCESGTSVRDVYVAGLKLVDHGRITCLDEAELLREIAERMPTLQGRIDDGRRAAERLRPYLEQAYDDCLRDPLMHDAGRAINGFTVSNKTPPANL